MKYVGVDDMKRLEVSDVMIEQRNGYGGSA